MMTLSLPEIETQIKTLRSDRLAEAYPDVESEPASGSIVIQISLRGIDSIRILADQSDECDRLTERLAAVRPVMDVLEQMFTDKGSRLS